MKTKITSLAMLTILLASSCRQGTNKDLNSMENPMEEVSKQTKESMEEARERNNPMKNEDSAAMQDSVRTDSTKTDSVR